MLDTVYAAGLLDQKYKITITIKSQNEEKSYCPLFCKFVLLLIASFGQIQTFYYSLFCENRYVTASLAWQYCPPFPCLLYTLPL